MPSWGHNIDPHTIVEIDYEFEFETSISHLNKVAFRKVRATATLVAKPDITVSNLVSTRYRPVPTSSRPICRSQTLTGWR